MFELPRPRPSLRLVIQIANILLTLTLGACDRAQPEAKPTPPPPSEKVPDAPGPDNRVREMPPPAQTPPKTSRQPGDYGGLGRSVGAIQ